MFISHFDGVFQAFATKGRDWQFLPSDCQSWTEAGGGLLFLRDSKLGWYVNTSKATLGATDEEVVGFDGRSGKA